MAIEKKNEAPTGKVVRDTQGAATESPAQNKVQVHQGNIPVLTVQLLSEISISLRRIADVMEKTNGGR